MNELCFECDEPADHQHHVVPKSQGGKRTIPLCELCHTKVHGKNMHISELTKKALEKLRANNKKTGSTPKYGYKFQDDNAVVNEEEMKVVDAIRELRLEGWSIRETSEFINEMGFRNRKGKTFKKDTIQRIRENHNII